MKTALITGASSGIGEEFAKLFAKDKINLVLVARSENKLKDLANELHEQFGVAVKVLAKDLSVLKQVEEVYEELQQQNISIDYLVNNAGFGDYNLFAESDWKKQEEMINLNIMALTKLTHLFLPAMVKNKFGKVLNVASAAAFQPGPTMSVYYASKAFVLHFSEAISNELEGTGVSVTALCPGAFESGFQKAASLEESRLVKGKKLPTSKEIAAFGYKHLMKGTRVCIPGTMNYIMANSVRFTPRSLVLKIVRMMQDKAN
ncbi:sulfoacetaldehyde reductase [mine drainage metagenome]|uniref:Sulfoacetaldehyde reductase n=1 Tax=mine drainage metagenome TaxID=410659 RepID=A0A1J5SLP5_9ZZZZ